MKEKVVNIHMLKTYYSQWGEYTAFNSFLPYFDARRFRITMRNVPIGDKNFRLPFPPLKKYLRRKIKENNVLEYRLNDLAAEFSVFSRGFFRGIDVVHFIDAEHSLMFLPRWYRKSRYLKRPPKIVAMFHQPPSVFETYPLINMDIVKQVDHILVVSPVQAEYFEQYVPRERISTILLGVDTAHFTPVPGKKNSGTFKCLAGGIWLRDYESLVKTAEILADRPGVEFHIVSSRFGELETPGNVFFHEGISDEALLELYRSCHVLFMPFKDATANTFLLEGAACGLPVVSSDLPSVRTYFPGEEAILIRDNTPEAFAETLVDLYENRQKLSRMSVRARERAQELSWENITKEYERMYMDL